MEDKNVSSIKAEEDIENNDNDNDNGNNNALMTAPQYNAAVPSISASPHVQSTQRSSEIDLKVNETKNDESTPLPIQRTSMKSAHSRVSSIKSIINMPSVTDLLHRTHSVEDIAELIGLDINVNREQHDIVTDKLHAHLSIYNGPNPFLHSLPFNCYEKFKIILFIISGILLLKIVLLIVLLLLLYLSLLIHRYMCCSNRCCQLIYKLYFRVTIRVILFIHFGIYWIPTKYPKDIVSKWKKWPRIITPNHVSLVDALSIVYLFGGCFLAKKSLESIPIVGSLMTSIGTIYVDRSTKQSRKQVITQMKAHVSDSNNPQIIIFPQGTTSNTLTITQFKPGAFIAGLDVQPIAIHYKNCFCDMALLNGIAFESVHSMCQFINLISIEYLKPYSPSEAEKRDAILFGNNVRKLIAEKLNATCTPHTFDDLLLQYFADDLHKQNMDAGINMIENSLFIMDDCHRNLNMRAKTVIKLGKLYMQHCDSNGAINLRNFQKIFRVRDDQFAMILFDVLMGERTQFINIEIDGKKQSISRKKTFHEKYIMFDDFVCAIAICYQDEHIDDAQTLLYSMMDRNQNGEIGVQQCLKLVQTIENDAGKPCDFDMERFFGIVFEQNNKAKLDYHEFKMNCDKFKQNHVVQGFLQFIIKSFLGIQLDHNMDVVEFVSHTIIQT